MLGSGIGFAVILGITGTLGFDVVPVLVLVGFGEGLGLMRSIDFVPPIKLG